ncbi:unnamed protein product [Symbiodinium sp. CCMP2592]|nr:unnamed protein product [Symbiodinium sp. CCMP2592]
MEAAVLGGSRQGVRQRTARLQEEEEESELAVHLYRQFLWGHQSLAQVRTTAGLASDELTRKRATVPKQLATLAGLGGSTDLTHNLWRDLERRVQPPFLEPRYEMLPLFPRPGRIPFFDPVQTFECLRTRRPEFFKEVCLPSVDELEEFWNQCSGHPALRHHPVRNIRGFQRRAVPLVLHGDGVPITAIGASQKSCAFISWRSLLCQRAASKCQHQLMAAIWCDLIVKAGGEDTVQSLWALVCQSFDAALDEAAGHQRPFPVLLFASGDLEWFSLAHGLPRWNSLKPCGLCGVARQAMFGFRAVPRVPADPWILPRHDSHILCRRTLCKASVFPDMMHTKHLGVDQRICGSVIWLLVHTVMPGDVESNRIQLVEELHRAHRGRGERPVSRLTPGMYLSKVGDVDCRESYPCLKCKAAETKATVAALKTVWGNRMDPQQELHILTNLLLELSVFLDTEVSSSSDWHPTKAESEQWVLAGVSLAQCLTKLTKEHLKLGRCLFQLTFKAHWLIHCLHYSEYMNPKFLWTYSGEDYMSRCKTLLKSCLNGRKQLPALQRFGRQYARAICVEVDKEFHRPLFV